MLLGDATDIAALIADGADVNERNSDGDTPLIVACEHGLTEVVAVLLAANASVDLAVIALIPSLATLPPRAFGDLNF